MKAQSSSSFKNLKIFYFEVLYKFNIYYNFLSLGIIITYYKENIMIIFTKTHIRCPASSSDLPQSAILLCPFSMCDTDMKPEKPCL